MKEFLKNRPVLTENLFIWIPLVLWLALWSSISAGRVQNVAHPERFFDFVNGVRALLPFIAGSIGIVILTIKVQKDRPDSSFFTGPLGFLFVYAAIGIVGTLSSPDKSQSIYWAGSYISVPIVLWAIGSGSNSLARVQRTVDLTMLLMVFAGLVLLVFAFAKLNLADAFTNPRLLEHCQFGNAWFTNSSGYLRSTGVGRYAALAGLISISGLAGFSIFGGGVGTGARPRIIWGIIFLALMLLLLSSGARSSFVAFCAAALVMTMLYWGKRAFIVGAVFSVVFIPVILITGVLDTAWNECLLQNYKTVPSVPNTTTVPLVESTTGADSGSVDQGTASGGGDTTSATNPSELPLLDDAPLISFSGRTDVWKDGLDIFKDSPIIGKGFHADRIILEAHIHNTFIHSLVQAGILGTIPMVVGMLFAWLLFLQAARKLKNFSREHSIRIVLAGSVIVFFSVRSIAESSGAFFGIDWLVLAPALLYISVVTNSKESRVKPPSSP